MQEKSEEQIYNELLQSGYTNKYPDWRPKPKGYLSGIVLRGGSKFPKEIYVKVVPSFNQCFDYLVLTVAKKCGVRSPKVKLKETKDHYYFFSTGVDTQKEENKRYAYQDLADFPRDSLDLSLLEIITPPKQELFSTNSMLLDKISAARFFIICLIFGLKDLNPHNIGIVVSQNLETREQKAKLTLLDFEVHDLFDLHDFLKDKQTEDFKNYVKAYLNYSSKESWMDPQLKAIANQLGNEDFIKSFEKIETNFLESFEQSIKYITPVLNKINETAMMSLQQSTLELWRSNFAHVKEKISLLQSPNNSNQENYSLTR